MYKATDIAQYILYRGVQLNRSITLMMLQNMLYDIQKESLQLFNRPMFFEIIEAWGNGPFIPKVYYKYAGAGASEIYEFKKPDVEFEIEDKNIIERVMDSYKDDNPWLFKERVNSAYNRALNGDSDKPIIKRDDIKIFG